MTSPLSQRRWGWVLLALCALSLFVQRDGRLALPWMALIWACALASPRSLRWHPAAGAWIGWGFWAGLSGLQTGERMARFEPWLLEATCVLLFILAHAWWGGAHRRAWMIGLCGMAPLTVALWPRPVAAGLLAAAAAACWGIWMGSRESLSRWRRGLAAAGICALAFVLVYGSWGAWFGFFVSAAACAAQSLGRGRRAVPTVLLLAAALGLVLRRLGGAEPYALAILRETGWIGLGLFACAAFQSLPDNFRGLSWEARAASAALYAVIAEGFVDPIPGGAAFQVVLFSAVACASNWARAHEESGLGKLMEDTHEWTKPWWAASLGLAFCLALAGAQRMKRSAEAAAAADAAGARLEGLRSLARLEPSNVGVKIRLARELLYSNPGQVSAPLARLDEAILLEERPLLYALKAELFFRAGDWPRGGRWAEKAVARDPGFDAARLMRAEALARRGENEEARAELRVARRSRGRADWDETRYQRVQGMLRNAAAAEHGAQR